MENQERVNAACYKVLDTRIRNKELIDLHTHLLGMGSADFWVHRIIMTYLIRIAKNGGPFGTQKELLKHLKTLLKYQLYEINDESQSPTDTLLKRIEAFVKDLQRDNTKQDYTKFTLQLDLFESLQASESHLNSFLTRYTEEVVYTRETLLRLFGIIEEGELSCNSEELKRFKNEELTSKLEHLLGVDCQLCDYIVFNARSREFQLKKYAITNSTLVKIIKSKLVGDSAMAAVRNGFSMLSRDGKIPSEPDLVAYRGNFTPEFYPGRFKMKDCIYEQRMEVLSILINHVVSRYNNAGIHYVEFSLGVKDLLNSDIWKHIADGVYSSSKQSANKEDKTPKGKKRKRGGNEIQQNPASEIDHGHTSNLDSSAEEDEESDGLTVADGVDVVRNDNGEANSKLKEFKVKPIKSCAKWTEDFGFYNHKPRDFQIKFLAAFNRSPINVGGIQISNRDDAIAFLLKNNGIDAKKLDSMDETIEEAFPHIFGANKPFQKLQRMFSKVDKMQAALLSRWLKNVVGFDWVGDEYGFPYCALKHSGILNFVKQMRNLKTESRFGIRIHAGESLPLPNRDTSAEDSAVCQAFETHISILNSSMTTIYEGINGLHFRIGHGVAFLQGNSDAARESRAFLKEKKIVCELNMTSNQFLLHSGTYNNDHNDLNLAIREFRNEEIPVVICTDDDGIWPIRKCKLHYQHISVSGEFCKAIGNDCFENSEQVEDLIKAAKSAAFY